MNNFKFKYGENYNKEYATKHGIGKNIFNILDKNLLPHQSNAMKIKPVYDASNVAP